MSREEAVHFIPQSPGQIEAWKQYRNSDVMILSGIAGSGKTHCALALALADLFAEKTRKVYLSRPLVTCGEDLGFLKGGLQQKLDPWMGAIHDVIGNITHTKFKILLESGRIEYAPLAYMRGRTISGAVAILDEAQNATFPQLKMFLTRLGRNGKLILCGDPEQSDLPRPAFQRVHASLSGLAGVSTVHFAGEQSVRHPLIPHMLQRLNTPLER